MTPQFSVERSEAVTEKLNLQLLSQQTERLNLEPMD